MNLLVDAVNRHPAIVVFAVLLALALVAYAADVFVGFAERDEPGPDVRRWWRQSWCWVRTGHEDVPIFEATRVRLRCVICRHESPGVVIGGRPPRLRYEGDPRRHALKPARLVIGRSA